MVANSSLHRRINAQSLVNPAEIAVRIVERHSRRVILNFLGGWQPLARVTGPRVPQSLSAARFLRPGRFCGVHFLRHGCAVCTPDASAGRISGTEGWGR